jgi:hypothetical protein
MSEYPSLPEMQEAPEKPALVQAIAVMTLVNGILNVMYGLGVTLLIIVGTLGFGIICAPLTILPAILGIFEVLYAVKLLPDYPGPTKPNQTLAILEICAIIAGNVVSLVIGILNLVFLNDEKVKAYFANLNSRPTIQV